MKLGCFSVSLSVKDIIKSRDFYQQLGFEVFAGDIKHNYLIMKNGDTNIGLFQGMFEGNLLTFNPGWDQAAGELDAFDDVRDLLKNCQQQGHEISQNGVNTDAGPGSFSVSDPDGNIILIDQHR